MTLFILFILGLSVTIYFAAHVTLRRARRKKLVVQTPPAAWTDILRHNVVLYRLLPDELKHSLHGHMQILIAEKHFEGCGGLTLTDEMKVTIAGQAAILLIGQPKPAYFPKAISILVYPSVYVAQETTRDGFIVTEGRSVRLGESWVRGVVVLAWDQVKRQSRGVGSGHNVVLHEFAHQLDQENGPGTGTPHLASRERYAEWARVMSREYEALRDKALHHLGDVMDSYGATDPAEFFAVATETFFTNPHGLKRAREDLYDELREYYRVDPASW